MGRMNDVSVGVIRPICVSQESIIPTEWLMWMKPNLVAILCFLDDRMAEESEELAMIAEKARALLNRQERQV